MAVQRLACTARPRPTPAGGPTLRRGRALPPHLLDPAALLAGRRCCASWSPRTARWAPRCTRWPASASPTSARSSTRPSRLPERVWRARLVVMGQETRAPSQRPASAARATGVARGARAAAALVRRAATGCSPCCWPRAPTSTTSCRRSSPTRSSGTSCAPGCARRHRLRCATARREARGGARRRGRRLGAPR